MNETKKKADGHSQVAGACRKTSWTCFSAGKEVHWRALPSIFWWLLYWGSPIPLLKTVSRISNWPFLASRKMQKTPSRSRKKAGNHVSRRNASAKHIRKEKQRQACTDSQCGFCGCVASKALQIIVLLLKACLLQLNLSWKIWSEAY